MPHLPILPSTSHCIVMYFDVLCCISLYFNVLRCICLFIYLHCTVLYCFALNCSWVDNGHDMWHIQQTCIIFKKCGITAGNVASSPKHFQKIYTLYGNLPQTPLRHPSDTQTTKTLQNTLRHSQTFPRHPPDIPRFCYSFHKISTFGHLSFQHQ